MNKQSTNKKSSRKLSIKEKWVLILTAVIAVGAAVLISSLFKTLFA